MIVQPVAARLATFLLARIADDEAVAESLPPGTAEWWTSRLAECEAKRRIVAEFEVKRRLLVGEMDSRDWRVVMYVTMERVLRHLALPYADHPDYCNAWRL